MYQVENYRTGAEWLMKEDPNSIMSGLWEVSVCKLFAERLDKEEKKQITEVTEQRNITIGIKNFMRIQFNWFFFFNNSLVSKKQFNLS